MRCPPDNATKQRRFGSSPRCDEVFVHQIGADQDGFLRFYGEEVLPKV
jgi:hypothetical protein